ncbi:formate--tetrahydrofolate ligase [Phocaeicola dorei]|uniref:Formate--tetrahydrofolate ligase n=1 Tax=Phocaeicola dorei TaxID=357276 RepID=A0A642PLE8_9BACT|nr:formate--tetrahydrofolate ligase [Phocaeicola dorei]
MATFKVVVRKKRADGFYPVYIRVVHRSRMGYIKTDKLITDKQITKNGEIKDIVVNNGAEMIVAIAGEILRMPGLPKKPQAEHIDIVDGNIEGLS